MPADEYQVQIASWPGAAGVVSCRYLCGHGITPGVATLVVTLPPAGAAGFGDLVLSDGNRSLRLRDCKLENVQFDQGDDGQRWTLLISDRRWRWENGTLAGVYNQLDPHNKLVPWTIRSPKELVELCLEAMGERNYSIDVPPGVSGADYADKGDWFDLGANTPFGAGLVNPFVEWNVETPAQALSRLCGLFNCRVVFDPVADRVLVAKPGDGAALPEDFLESRGVNVEAPKTPSLIGVVGAEMQFEMLLRLRAVLPEWHKGEYVPVNQASYRPKVLKARGWPWDKSPPGGHSDVQPTERINLDGAKHLAVQNLWSLYRLDDVGVNPPPQQEPQMIDRGTGSSRTGGGCGCSPTGCSGYSRSPGTSDRLPGRLHSPRFTIFTTGSVARLTRSCSGRPRT